MLISVKSEPRPVAVMIRQEKSPDILPVHAAGIHFMSRHAPV
jgi:hypothetical protein